MAHFWRTKGFKQLSGHWNKKLEATGFCDAEIELKGDRALRQRATNSYRQATQLERDSRIEYYSFLGHLANNTIFPNELERTIMLRHSEGAQIKEIVKEINAKGIARERKTVKYIIRRWQNKWGIRSWSLRQMNLKK